MNERLPFAQEDSSGIGRRFWHYFTKDARQKRELEREQLATKFAKEWVDNSRALSEAVKEGLRAHPTEPSVLPFRAYDRRGAILNYAELIYAHLMGNEEDSVVIEANADPVAFSSREPSTFWKPINITTREYLLGYKPTAEVFRPTTLEGAEGEITDMRFLFTLGANNTTSSGILIVSGPHCHADLDKVAKEAADSQWRADSTHSIMVSFMEV